MERGRKCVCAGLSGSVESFHPIVFYSLHFEVCCIRCIDLKTRFVLRGGGQTPLKLQVQSMRTTRGDVSLKRKRYIGEAVLRYCRNHPGVALNIGGPRAKGMNRKMSIHLVKKKGSNIFELYVR